MHTHTDRYKKTYLLPSLYQTTPVKGKLASQNTPLPPFKKTTKTKATNSDPTKTLSLLHCHRGAGQQTHREIAPIGGCTHL